MTLKHFWAKTSLVCAGAFVGFQANAQSLGLDRTLVETPRDKGYDVTIAYERKISPYYNVIYTRADSLGMETIVLTATDNGDNLIKPEELTEATFMLEKLNGDSDIRTVNADSTTSRKFSAFLNGVTGKREYQMTSETISDQAKDVRSTFGWFENKLFGGLPVFNPPLSEKPNRR
jgi:hypothetical protein